MFRFRFIKSAITFFPFVLALYCSQQSENPKSTIAAISQNTETGNITGRVVFIGEVPKRFKLTLVKDIEVCGIDNKYDEGLIVSKNSGIQNAVVYLSNVKNGKSISSLGSKFILDQQGCRYNPHVLVVPVDTPLEILNNDGILHNFHTFCKINRPCNISQPEFRKKMELTFEHPEFIQVRCDIHGWMNGWIIAVDHPYYVISEEDGNFYLDDVPPGTYTLNCWQEKLKEQTIQVTVIKGSTASVSFSYSNDDV